MSLASRANKRFVFFWFFAGTIPALFAQNAYVPQGGEYSIAGSLPGDQVFPQVAVGTNGGYLGLQENANHGDGLGISAQRVNSTLSGAVCVFRGNKRGVGDQRK